MSSTAKVVVAVSCLIMISPNERCTSDITNRTSTSDSLLSRWDGPVATYEWDAGGTQDLEVPVRKGGQYEHDHVMLFSEARIEVGYKGFNAKPEHQSHGAVE
ncbi:hypothetical protein BDZ89DRAFT_1050392 [Hymenopellis radicata]|nr:hypothetical protein BDZ89DRAFT_1050392 [Hymenopellis radicata]